MRSVDRGDRTRQDTTPALAHDAMVNHSNDPSFEPRHDTGDAYLAPSAVNRLPARDVRLRENHAKRASQGAGHPLVAPRPRLSSSLLLLSDVFALLLSMSLGVFTAGLAAASPDALRGALPLLALATVVPLGFDLLGLYPGAGVGPVEELRRILAFLAAFWGGLLVLSLVSHSVDRFVLLVVCVSWVLSTLLLPSGRAMVRHLFARRAWWGVPAVLLGAGKTADLLTTRMRTHPGVNLKIVCSLDDDPAKHGREVGGVPVVGSLDRAPEIRQRYGVRYAIVAMPGAEPQRLSDMVHELGTVFPSVVVIPNAFGLTSIGVGAKDSGGLVGLHVRGHLSVRRNRIIKRALDLALLLPLAAMSLPVIGLCAIAVFVVSPGNPFYRQEREGYRGRRIRVWKLRTMYRDADRRLEEHLRSDPEAQREWSTRFKLRHDPRVLPYVGRFLRRSSLDELPQILNIAVGELSFVGPRPFPYYHLAQFDGNFRKLRSSVVPGLTGYWQVASRSEADLLAQVELDSYYIRNWSLWFDLYLIARTPWAVIFGSGAY